jgi:hypothetical protein
MSSTDGLAGSDVSPALVVDGMFAYRKTAALKAAIELGLFTSIGGERRTATSLAAETGYAERGLRILCDFLVVAGFLTKSGEDYALTPSSQVFLDRRSPAYMGAAIDFLASPEMVSLFLDDPAACVRNGGAVGLANVAPDNPVWVRFARAMGAFTGGSAQALASEVAGWPKPPAKVLDVAAGPGAFGIEIAKVAPSAGIVALDWKPVLAVTEQNAGNAGVAAPRSCRGASSIALSASPPGLRAGTRSSSWPRSRPASAATTSLRGWLVCQCHHEPAVSSSQSS